MKNRNPICKPIIAAALIFSLYGCSSAKQLTYQSTSDLSAYKTVTIQELNIRSDESNPSFDEANNSIETFYNESTLSALTSINKQIIEPSTDTNLAQQNILILERKVHIHYGSRALRYWVGWGAGKGYATITITGKDQLTGEEKYNDIKEFTLSMGVFGGSFEKMVKEQISLQLNKFVIAAK